MKNSIAFLTFLNCWLLVTPTLTPADQVSKNSVILKEVQILKDSKGVPLAEESMYGGGISGKGQGVALKELRNVKGPFTFSKGETTITAKVIPLVAERNHHGMWIPAIGKWDFQNKETNSYEGVIHVKKGGDLDIVYQSTEMSMGNREHVLHYGLSGNPHAVSLSRTRLKTASLPPQIPLLTLSLS